ncbi:hypothetical protein M2333_002667 [Sphingobium sp. B11D3B]|nr:hypothetical protein [Sphingobium sp. B11D3B]
MTIKALHIAVLLQLPWRDVMPLDAAILGPSQDRQARKLSAVIADDHEGLTASHDDSIELSTNTGA